MLQGGQLMTSEVESMSGHLMDGKEELNTMIHA